MNPIYEFDDFAIETVSFFKCKNCSCELSAIERYLLRRSETQ